MAQFIKDCQI